jgi:hypothetical protein
MQYLGIIRYTRITRLFYILDNPSMHLYMCLSIDPIQHVGAKPSNCTLIAASSLCHLEDSKFIADNHIIEMLRSMQQR